MNLVIQYLKLLWVITYPDLKKQLNRIEKKLDNLLAIHSGQFAGEIGFDLEVEGTKTKGVIEVKLTDSQQGVLTIRPVNKAGKPAPVQDGSIIWTGPPFVAITPDPSNGGRSATVVAMGLGGPEKISVSADADLGEGVVTISGQVDIEVVASQAVSLGIEEGPITEQVAPGPTPNPV